MTILPCPFSNNPIYSASSIECIELLTISNNGIRGFVLGSLVFLTLLAILEVANKFCI